MVIHWLCIRKNNVWWDVLIQLQRSGSALQNIRQSVTRLYILRKDDKNDKQIHKGNNRIEPCSQTKEQPAIYGKEIAVLENRRI